MGTGVDRDLSPISDLESSEDRRRMRQEFVTDLRLAFQSLNVRENNESSDVYAANNVSRGWKIS